MYCQRHLREEKFLFLLEEKGENIVSVIQHFNVIRYFFSGTRSNPDTAMILLQQLWLNNSPEGR